MKSQKVENLLNLALDATEEEREKSLELDIILLTGSGMLLSNIPEALKEPER